MMYISPYKSRSFWKCSFMPFITPELCFIRLLMSVQGSWPQQARLSIIRVNFFSSFSSRDHLRSRVRSMRPLLMWARAMYEPASGPSSAGQEQSRPPGSQRALWSPAATCWSCQRRTRLRPWGTTRTSAPSRDQEPIRSRNAGEKSRQELHFRCGIKS